MEVVIITGLSGAGKTKAADWFEDEGYYCIDNMPPSLIKNFLELSKGKGIEKAAFVIDIRGGSFFGELKEAASELRKDENVAFKILFIEASPESLVRRYNETRRSHPLAAAATTKEVIEEERHRLAELRQHSNYIIDTTTLKVADLYAELDHLFSGKIEEGEKDTFVLNIMSFGYKHGVPPEVDWIIDARFIPNPFYVPTLKKLTGNNKKVSKYVLKQKIAQEFLEVGCDLLRKLIPNYVREGKYSLTLAIGCTGGQHRSVAIANEIHRIFSEEGRRVTLEHRDI